MREAGVPGAMPVEKPPQNVGDFPGLNYSSFPGAEFSKSEPGAEFYGRAGTEAAAGAAAVAGGVGRDPPPFYFIHPARPGPIPSRSRARSGLAQGRRAGGSSSSGAGNSFRISLGLSRAVT